MTMCAADVAKVPWVENDVRYLGANSCSWSVDEVKVVVECGEDRDSDVVNTWSVIGNVGATVVINEAAKVN